MVIISQMDRSLDVDYVSGFLSRYVNGADRYTPQ
jgi:hypothetical protein